MKRILIVKPSSLGDVLHAFPAAYQIMGKARKEFPGEEIFLDWVISPAFTELLDFLPFPGEKILFDRKKLGHFSSFPRTFFTLFRELRKRGKYEAVYDLQGLLRSSLIGAIAPSRCFFGSSAPREKGAKLFYSQQLSPGAPHTHAVEKLLHMVSSGENAIRREEFFLPLHNTFRERALAKAQEYGIPHLLELSGKKRLFAITPGARWESKEWPAAFFGDCGKLLHESYPEAEFLILGSGDEKEKGDAICRELEGKAPSYNLCGATSIGELAELIRLSSLLLCNDSGPMHIGAFTKTPIIALFGPTDPVLTGPWCREKQVLQCKLPCTPCFKRNCPGSLACQAAISPHAVEEAAKKLLSGQ